MDQPIAISALSTDVLNRVRTAQGAFDPTQIQQEIEANRKVITAYSADLQRQTDAAAAATTKAATDTAAVAKQMAASVQAEVESTMKALGELTKSDPSALLEL